MDDIWSLFPCVDGRDQYAALSMNKNEVCVCSENSLMLS
jgi:hypothetical protein